MAKTGGRISSIDFSRFAAIEQVLKIGNNLIHSDPEESIENDAGQYQITFNGSSQCQTLIAPVQIIFNPQSPIEFVINREDGLEPCELLFSYDNVTNALDLSFSLLIPAKTYHMFLRKKKPVEETQNIRTQIKLYEGTKVADNSDFWFNVPNCMINIIKNNCYKPLVYSVTGTALECPRNKIKFYRGNL